jgi:hypothetical protein
MDSDKGKLDSFSFSAERPISRDDEDLLGHVRVADTLVSIITRAQTPLTVGLYGEWGSGKTGVINLIAKRLASMKIPTAYVDCWKYEGSEGLVLPLFASLAEDRTAPEMRSFSKVVGTLLLCGADVGLHAATFGALRLKDVKENLGEIEGRILQKVDAVGRVQEEFKKAVEQVATGDRFIIFVDNLDRCRPENAVSLLESVRNLLAVEKCVFVIAVDDAVLISYIDQKYSGTKVDGKKYLEKVVDFPYAVPNPTAGSITGLVSTLFSKILPPPIVDSETKLVLETLRNYTQPLNPRTLRKALVRYAVLRLTKDRSDRAPFVLALLYEMHPRFLEWFARSSLPLRGVFNSFIKEEHSPGGKSMKDILKDVVPPEYLSDPQLKNFLRTFETILYDRGKFAPCLKDLAECGLPDLHPTDS